MALPSRSGAIDLVRVLALIGVVAGHVWEGGLVERLVYPWHVPVFFILTGYLWTSGRSFRFEAQKRWATLLIPYLTWLALIWAAYAALLVVHEDVSLTKLTSPIYGGATAVRPFTAFWFVTVLFFACVLYRLIERLPMWVQWIIAVAGVAVTHITGDLLARTPLGIATAVPSLVFVLIGVMFKRWHCRIAARPVITGASLLFSGAALVVSGISEPVNLKFADFGVPVIGVLTASAISLGIILIAEAVVPALPEVVSTGVTALAVGGMMVVLTHAAVLWALKTPGSGNVIHFLVALILPWVAALALSRTPMAPWLVGIARRNRHSHGIVTVERNRI